LKGGKHLGKISEQLKTVFAWIIGVFILILYGFLFLKYGVVQVPTGGFLDGISVECCTYEWKINFFGKCLIAIPFATILFILLVRTFEDH
jgi:hypothetical protein